MKPEKIERRPSNEERLEVLRGLFPEVFADGCVNVERLRELLEDGLSDASSTEHYGLRWPGKLQARRLANQSPAATLRMLDKQGVSENTTGNIVAIGDNLQVLLALQKSYANSVRLIYIDPPYNTGRDFIYRDDFKEPVAVYLEATRQADLSGLLVSNPKSNGRFHSHWLSMMLPRLAVARTFLASDGVVAVSIDDNEVHNLRHLMDEVFGPENYLATIIWNKGHSQQQGLFKEYHEYVVVYAKAKENVKPFAARETGDVVGGALKKVSRQNPKSEFEFPSGIRIDAPDGTEFVGTWGDSEQVELVKGRFRVKNGRTMEPMTLAAGWTQLNQMRALYYGKADEPVRDSRGQIVLEFFFNSAGKLKYRKERSVETPATVQEWGKQATASDSLAVLFGGQTPFDRPKPVALVKDLIGWVCADPGDIVLDFFGGSGTTAQAVWESNIESGASRRFVLVQIDAPIEDAGDGADAARALGATTIANVTLERLRRASAALEARGSDHDLGFRVFKEDSPALARPLHLDAEQLEKGQLSMFKDKLANVQPADLFTEVLLLLGFPLDAKREQVPQNSANTLWRFEHPRVQQPLLLCLDQKIDDDLFDALKDKTNHTFVCRDEALSDLAKARFYDALKLADSTFKVL